jgi:hypothetical protein
MQPSHSTDIDAAASELIRRLGQRGALNFTQERLERLEHDGDWSSHATAALMLSAIERAAAAQRPAKPAIRSRPSAN